MKPSKSMIVLFLAPAILFYLVIFAYPAFQSTYLSFHSVSSFTGRGATFVGINNYLELVHSPLFIDSFMNFLRIWFIGGAVLFGLAFFFTILLTSGIKGKSFFRAVIYLPNVISVVALTTCWTQYVFNPKFGLYTTFFKALGLDTLASFQWGAPANVFQGMLTAYIWGAVGYFLLIILAGVERIPIDYYEAARLDGANLIQVFFQITLPLLRDVMRISLVMWSISAINFFSFGMAWNPVTVGAEVYTPAIYLYNKLFGANQNAADTIVNIGLAAAVGVCMLGLVLLASIILNRLFKQENLEY
jgi:ABC-type sugar transport system permease subunit